MFQVINDTADSRRSRRKARQKQSCGLSSGRFEEEKQSIWGNNMSAGNMQHSCLRGTYILQGRQLCQKFVFFLYKVSTLNGREQILYLLINLF